VYVCVCVCVCRVGCDVSEVRIYACSAIINTQVFLQIGVGALGISAFFSKKKWNCPVECRCSKKNIGCSRFLAIIYARVYMCVPWHIHVCDMTHAHVWHDGCSKCSIESSCVCHMTCSCVWHASLTCVTWLIHMCHTPHSYLWHASFIRVTRFTHMCDTPHWHVWRDSFICVTHLNLCIFLHYPPNLRHKQTKIHIFVLTISHIFSLFFLWIVSFFTIRPTYAIKKITFLCSHFPTFFPFFWCSVSFFTICPTYAINKTQKITFLSSHFFTFFSCFLVKCIFLRYPLDLRHKPKKQKKN